MRNFGSLEELRDCVGQEIGVSEWITIDQKRIDTFAEATGDHQWIHVDAERAAQGPFGGTIAHGYLTLSLVPMLTAKVMKVDNVKLGVNYGVNKVRFPAPVKVDSRIRCRVRLVSMEALPSMGALGGYQVVMESTIECEGSDKPVAVAQTVGRRYR